MPAWTWTLRRVEVPAPEAVEQATFSTAWGVTPSDTVYLEREPSLLFVAEAGDLSVRLPNGQDILFSCPAGSYLPLRAVRVNATGTTASGILAIY